MPNQISQQLTRQQQAVSVCLQQLCQALKDCQLWSEQSPSVQALQSQQPFCLDSLSFQQWLQFVLVERLTKIIAEQQTLPKLTREQGMLPMAEETLSQKNCPQVLKVIRQLDELLTIA